MNPRPAAFLSGPIPDNPKTILISAGTAPIFFLVGGSRSEPGEGLIRAGTAPNLLLVGGSRKRVGGRVDKGGHRRPYQGVWPLPGRSPRGGRRRVGKGGMAPYKAAALPAELPRLLVVFYYGSFKNLIGR